jgi:hypothetical protein
MQNQLRFGEIDAAAEAFLRQLGASRASTDDGIVPTVLVTHRSDVGTRF